MDVGRVGVIGGGGRGVIGGGRGGKKWFNVVVGGDVSEHMVMVMAIATAIMMLKLVAMKIGDPALMTTFAMKNENR